MEPVVIYARASSTEQSASVPDQLAALRKHAKTQKYKILREYIDDGKSGSKEIAKRVAFHRMVHDSATLAFTRILVWDSARFGRLDSQIGAEHKLTLRRNGVTILECLNGGTIDWSSQMGRLQDALMSEADHDYALKISANSIRGRISRLEQGFYPHGMIPYGYDREYTGNDKTLRIPREQAFRMPRGWSRKLVINDAEAETVRLIYDLFVNRSQSMLAIMRELTRRGIPGWKGRAWTWNSVRKILSDKSYIGYAVVGKALVPKKEVHKRLPTGEIPGIVPPIVDPQLWHDAQRLLAGKKGFGKSTDLSKRVLAGVLVCGHCDYRLVARQRRQGEKEKQIYYSCCSGSRCGSACPQWRAYESEVLPRVLSELVRAVDSEVIARLTPQGDAPAIDPTASLTQEVESLREKVKRATLRAATADDELLAEYQEVARDLKKQLNAAEERLRMTKLVEADGGPGVWASWWADLRPGLVLASHDPELIQEVMDAHGKLPALSRVTGQGGWEEFKRAARDTLVRVAADGDPDPLRVIVPTILEADCDGALLDVDSLRGVLQKLGCEVKLYWVRNPKKKASQDATWVLDHGEMKIEFRWSATHADSTTTCMKANAATRRGRFCCSATPRMLDA